MTGTGLVVLKNLASFASAATYVSLAPQMYRIYKNQSPGEKSHFPLVGMLLNCHLWSIYWIMMHKIFPIFVATMLGELLSFVYLTIYIKYAGPQRSYAVKTLVVTVVILAIVTLYIVLGVCGLTGQSTDQVRKVLGYIADVAGICFYGSPMERIHRVLKTKSVEPIPIHMCVMGAITNGLWLVYGFLTSDVFVIIPNVFTITLTTTQLVLYVVFRPRSSSWLPRSSVDPAHISVVLSPTRKNSAVLDLGKLSPVERPSFHALRSPLTPLQNGGRSIQDAV